MSTREGLPERWAGDEKALRWSAPIPGEGNSSPVVFDRRVYITTAYPDPEGEADATEDGQWRVVIAYDIGTGQELWRHELFRAAGEKRHPLSTPAAATPVADKQGVYVYFGSVLAAIDDTGNLLWQQEVDPQYAKYSRYGAASSPVIAGDAVIVVQDQEYGKTDDIGWMAAYDKKTGDEIWRTEWDDTCCSYSTPVIRGNRGHEEIWFAGSGAILSYSASTGGLLWKWEYPMLQMVSTPVFEPFPGSEQETLLIIAGGADNQRGTVALRVAGSGAATNITELWQDRKLAPQAASPILSDGLLYSVTIQGILVCRDALSGEVLWRGRLNRPRNHASLVAGDGKIYVSSSGGMVSVVAQGREFDLLAENELLERGTTASPALADGCFLQRGEQHLFCFERHE